MDNDWDSKIIIGTKKQGAKVTKKDSDLNGKSPPQPPDLHTYPPLAARRAGAVVSVDKKIAAGGNKAHQGTDHQRIAKLDRENEVAPPAKISANVGRAIQSARMELQFSQKDLALKISEKPSVLQDYESGKATPDLRVLAKLEKILKVKLRGSDIGKKLEGPKKS